MDHHDRSADSAVFELIARLADNKYFLGRRYAEWCSSAPALESGVAAAAMAQDELGHARAIYPLLRDLAPHGADPAQIDPDTRTSFVNMAVLDKPFASWLEFVAANFLVDTALSTIFEAALTSAFDPLAARSRKVLQEEGVHVLHGEGWVRRLSRDVPAVREATEHALYRAWNEVLCWFGPPDATGELAERQVLDAPPDTLRQRFLVVVGPIIASTGLRLPTRRRDDGAWELTEALPWDAWDSATYRLEQGPVAGVGVGSATVGVGQE